MGQGEVKADEPPSDSMCSEVGSENELAVELTPEVLKGGHGAEKGLCSSQCDHHLRNELSSRFSSRLTSLGKDLVIMSQKANRMEAIPSTGAISISDLLRVKDFDAARRRRESGGIGV